MLKISLLSLPWQHSSATSSQAPNPTTSWGWKSASSKSGNRPRRRKKSVKWRNKFHHLISFNITATRLLLTISPYWRFRWLTRDFQVTRVGLKVCSSFLSLKLSRRPKPLKHAPNKLVKSVVLTIQLNQSLHPASLNKRSNWMHPWDRLSQINPPHRIKQNKRKTLQMKTWCHSSVLLTSRNHCRLQCQYQLKLRHSIRVRWRKRREASNHRTLLF